MNAFIQTKEKENIVKFANDRGAAVIVIIGKGHLETESKTIQYENSSFGIIPSKADYRNLVQQIKDKIMNGTPAKYFREQARFFNMEGSHFYEIKDKLAGYKNIEWKTIFTETQSLVDGFEEPRA